MRTGFRMITWSWGYTIGQGVLQAVLGDQRLEQLLKEGMVVSIDAVLQSSSRIST
jgi:hypothetical protein